MERRSRRDDPRIVYSDETIRRVREEVVNRGRLETDVARQEGMSQQYVSGVVRGRYRREAGGPILEHRRMFGGDMVPWSKLTREQAEEILRAKGKELQTVVAERYGVTPGMVSAIWHRRKWRHIALVPSEPGGTNGHVAREEVSVVGG